jgi:hypothetical protein
MGVFNASTSPAKEFAIPFFNPFVHAEKVLPTPNYRFAGSELDSLSQVITRREFASNGAFTGRCHDWLIRMLQCRKQRPQTCHIM